MTEIHGSGKHSRTVTYSNQETHLSLPIVILAKQSKEDLFIEAGEYSYPIQIVIPLNLPTSFEHSIGRTRYSITSSLDIPWYFLNLS